MIIREFIKREIIIGEPQLIRRKPLSEGLNHFLRWESLFLAIKGTKSITMRATAATKDLFCHNLQQLGCSSFPKWSSDEYAVQLTLHETTKQNDPSILHWHLTHRTCEIINGCYFKPVGLCLFAMQQQKPNAATVLFLSFLWAFLFHRRVPFDAEISYLFFHVLNFFHWNFF